MAEPTTLTKTIDVQETQPRWSELLSWVLAGREIIFAEGSTPLARLMPMASSAQLRQPGLHTGAIWMSHDLDQPLPDEFRVGGA
jgi:antitoxin (DNA-binding transcriptional repressor) of toxin-antitoxin stability system